MPDDKKTPKPTDPETKPVKWKWEYAKGDKGDSIVCTPSETQTCYVQLLWKAEESHFHDADLQAATDEISKILDRVKRDNEDESRHLSLINVEGRLMLVWTTRAEVIPSDAPAKNVAKALKIKR